MNRWILMAALAAVSVGFDSTALAELPTEFVTLLGADALSGGLTASSLAQKSAGWSNKAVADGSHDYYVGGQNAQGEDIYICTPNVGGDTATYVFQGRSLTLDGEYGHQILYYCSKASSTMDFGSGQVYLKGGDFVYGADGNKVVMNATVLSSEATPFRFRYNYVGTLTKYLTLNLSGETSSALTLMRSENLAGSLIWHLDGTAANFAGTLNVENVTVLTHDYPLGGTLRIGANATVKAVNGNEANPYHSVEIADGGRMTIDAGTTVRAGALVADGGTLRFQGFSVSAIAPQSVGFVEVTEGFTVRPGKALTVVIGKGEGQESIQMKDLVGCEVPIVRFPKGCEVPVDAFRLEVSATLLGYNNTDYKFMPPWKLVMKDDAQGYPTLYAVRQEMVTYVYPNPGSSTRPVQEEAAAWRDGQTPRTGVFYIAFGSSSNLEMTKPDFVGDTLFTYAGKIFFHTSSFAINSMQLNGSESLYVNQATTLSGGEIRVGEYGGDNWVQFLAESTASDNSVLTINSRLTGTGRLAINEYAYTGASKLNKVVLTGDNSGFTGKLTINRAMTATVGNGTVFGGARTATDYAAVQFNGACTLEALDEDVVFNEPTCGLVLPSSSQLNAYSGRSLAIWNPVTFKNGGLQKYGTGTLSLAETRFGESSAKDPGTVTDYFLAVREGTVKPLKARAFDGVRLYLQNGTGVRLDWETADGELRAKGIVNVTDQKAGNLPFQTQTTGGTFKFAFDMPVDFAYDGKPVTRGLMTVKTGLADTYRGRIVVDKTPFARARPVVVETDNGDGTTTFSVEIQVHGLLILVR